jgi:hypothetical protein
MGVVGGGERLECSLISDVVTRCAAVEEHTKAVGESILISARTRAELVAPDAFALRPVGDHALQAGAPPEPLVAVGTRATRSEAP